MSSVLPRVVATYEPRPDEASSLWEFVLRRQGLAENTGFSSIVDLVDASLGLHAARLPSPFATVLARVSAPDVGLTLFSPAVRAELITVRCMRKTLHTLPLPLAAAAHGATVHFRERDALRAITNAGVGTSTISRTIDSIVKLLDETGPLFHRDVETRLVSSGRTVPVIRLSLKLAWERGLLTYLNSATSWNRERRQFALTTRLHPGLDTRMDRTKATGELVRAYFDRYGPAGLKDAMWWSGLSRRDITAAMAESRREWVALRTPWSPAPAFMYRDRWEEFHADKSGAGSTGLNFLAHEDVALKAYFETRCRYLGNLPAEKAFNRIGEVLPTVLWRGQVVGTWFWDAREQAVGCRIARGVDVPRRLIRERAAAATATLRLAWSSAPARAGT